MVKVRIACAYLFSPKDARNDAFIDALSMTAVKKAYREKAKQYHPDLHAHDEPTMRERRTQRFVNIQKAFKLLELYLKRSGTPTPGPTPESRRESPPGQGPEPKSGPGAASGPDPGTGTQTGTAPDTDPDPGPPRKSPLIIAVGGGKGGIGKSLFSANLGIYLSSIGLDTVLIDLDLGGSNLHLLLGETRPKTRLSDFFLQKMPALDPLLVKTTYGPSFIGGNSAKYGIANIHHMQKLKLIKAIPRLQADCIILDLGGDTSYNVIDFFLTANRGVVMTTCDPAAYLDAYNYIKIALYRKLNRLFGPESDLHEHADTRLQDLIKEATQGPENTVAGIGELFDRVTRAMPEHLALVKHTVAEFKPMLVVNKVPELYDPAHLITRIQQVAEKKLSIQVDVMASFSHDEAIEASARTLVPFITKPLTQAFNHRFAAFAQKLLQSD